MFLYEIGKLWVSFKKRFFFKVRLILCEVKKFSIYVIVVNCIVIKKNKNNFLREKKDEKFILVFWKVVLFDVVFDKFFLNF